MKIRVNFEDVKKRVHEIDDIEQRINAQRKALRKTYNNLDLAWQGEAALTFKRKLDELIVELDNTTKDLITIRNLILIVGKSIQIEDERLADEISRAGGGFR